MKLRPFLMAVGFGFLSTQALAADQASQSQAMPAPTTTAAKPAAQQTAAPAQQAQTAAPAVEKIALPNIPTLPTDKDKISYSIGMDLGTNFKAHGIDIDPTVLARGIKDTLQGGQTLMTKEQAMTTLTAFQKQMMAKQKAAFTAESAKNLQEGQTFLTANKTKPGVVTTPTGLQYKVVTAGQGNKPTDTDTVTVDYSGSFINGQEFDSSYKRGKPVTFGVSDVIHGWTEALKLMQPGATYEIYVPPTLAYGAQGMPGVIGPNQTLVFKIHLISIKKA